MEILQQGIEIEDRRLAAANYLYLTYVSPYKGEMVFHINDYGYIISTVKLKNNKEYNIIFQCNGRLELDSVKSVCEEEIKFDLYQLKEYFLNGMSRYLKFNTEVYFRIINEEDPGEIKMVFTDYLECLEYLELLEK